MNLCVIIQLGRIFCNFEPHTTVATGHVIGRGGGELGVLSAKSAKKAGEVEREVNMAKQHEYNTLILTWNVYIPSLMMSHLVVQVQQVQG